MPKGINGQRNQRVWIAPTAGKIQGGPPRDPSRILAVISSVNDFNSNGRGDVLQQRVTLPYQAQIGPRNPAEPNMFLEFRDV